MRHRHEGPKERLEWERACAEFHKRYSALAFPGGYEGALERIKSGDPNAMEVAICFWNADRTFFGLAICSEAVQAAALDFIADLVIKAVEFGIVEGFFWFLQSVVGSLVRTKESALGESPMNFLGERHGANRGKVGIHDGNLFHKPRFE